MSRNAQIRVSGGGDHAPVSALLTQGPRIVNVGLAGFAEDLAARGVPVVHVAWRPPAKRPAKVGRLLARLAPYEKRIARANEEALRRIFAGDPVLVDVVRASGALPALAEFDVLHAGPPLDWGHMCGPMRGAVTGALVFEGWARDVGQAEKLAAAGRVRFRSNHELGAVGPMTGITTRSMPLLVVENRAFGNRAYCVINEGLGKVMRFGANDESVLTRLAWLRDAFGPAFSTALRAMGGLELAPMVARGLAMGDEMHQRNTACSALLLREVAPSLAKTVGEGGLLAQMLAFIAGNEQFFLNVSMAMAKSVMDPARGIEACTLVTAMCRNGTDFGVRVSATGDAWFTAPVGMPQGMYFPGYAAGDANPDMGDSAIMETIGLGAFAMAAAPAVVGFVGAGRASDAAGYTRAMGEIVLAKNPKWILPALDFEGVPTGIDVRKVCESGIQPVINTGIAHREPGIGQIGAGIARAPLACFDRALEGLVRTLE